jgi:hypothetical protein
MKVIEKFPSLHAAGHWYSVLAVYGASCSAQQTLLVGPVSMV